MASFNQVILLGNLTRDPQLKYLPSQTAVVEFGLACNRKFKGQNGEAYDEAAYEDCLAHVRGPEGKPCRTVGCLDRNACPYGVAYRYPAEVQAFHMKAFAKL